MGGSETTKTPGSSLSGWFDGEEVCWVTCRKRAWHAGRMNEDSSGRTRPVSKIQVYPGGMLSRWIYSIGLLGANYGEHRVWLFLVIYKQKLDSKNRTEKLLPRSSDSPTV